MYRILNLAQDEYLKVQSSWECDELHHTAANEEGILVLPPERNCLSDVDRQAADSKHATEEAPKVNETQMNNLMWILYFTVVVILIVIIYKYVKHKKNIKMEVVDDVDEREPYNQKIELTNQEIELSTVDIEHQPYTDSSENKDNEIFN